MMTESHKRFQAKWYKSNHHGLRVQKQRIARTPPRTLEEVRVILGLAERSPEEPMRGEPVALLPRALWRYVHP